MIIDSHLHLRDDRYVFAEGTPENIVALLDRAGIDKAVVFKIWDSSQASIEAGRAAAGKFPDRLIPYVYAVPSYETAVLAELERALSEGHFRGIKLHAGDCGLADYIVNPVLELAAARGVPCLIDYCGRYDVAERTARDSPKTTIIMAHLGKYLATDERLIDRFIDIARAHENVILDVSGVVMALKIRDAVARVGSRRVVWGSDGPRRAPDTVTFVEMELSKVRSLGLSENQEQDVLGRTIAALLEL